MVAKPHTRTYRQYNAAVAAGKRRANSTRKPVYVGMLTDLRFHLSDTDPTMLDWRWETYTICFPDGKAAIGRR